MFDKGPLLKAHIFMLPGDSRAVDRNFPKCVFVQKIANIRQEKSMKRVYLNTIANFANLLASLEY